MFDMQTRVFERTAALHPGIHRMISRHVPGYAVVGHRYDHRQMHLPQGWER